MHHSDILGLKSMGAQIESLLIFKYGPAAGSHEQKPQRASVGMLFLQ